MTESSIRRLLYTDPVWAAYAIADLQPGLAAHCTWRFASNGGDALIMLYRGLTPPVLFSMGAPDRVGRLLAAEAQAGGLPARVYLSIPDAHAATVAECYDVSADRRPMLRMALRRAVEIAVPAIPGLGDPHGMARLIRARPGVGEHGLFLGMAAEAIVAGASGVVVLSPLPVGEG